MSPPRDRDFIMVPSGVTETLEPSRRQQANLGVAVQESAEASRLRALYRRQLLDVPRDAAFDRLTRLASRIFNVEFAAITLLDRDRLYFIAEHGIGLEQMNREPGLCDVVVESARHLYLMDARTDPVSSSHSLVSGAFGLRFYAGVPLVTRDGFCIGSMCVFAKQPRALSSDERLTLYDLAESAIDLIERRLAEREMRETLESLESHVEERTTDLWQTVSQLRRVVTERHEAERLRNESFAQLEAIFSAYPDLFFVMKRDGTILTYSNGSQTWRFDSFDDSPDKKMQDWLPDDISSRFTEAFLQVREGQPPITLEYLIPISEGLRTYESRILPFEGNRVIAIIRDVTSIRSAEAKARRSERLASLGTLAAGMAHQINNPIGAILTASELALLEQDETQEPAIWRETLKHNVDQSRRCGQIVKSILQFSREETTDKWEEDINSVIQRACHSIQAYARSNDATVRFNSGGTAISVYMSPIEIEQVIINILRNAIESREQGAQVEISAVQIDRWVTVEVFDNGCGMDTVVQRQIFDPFYTRRLQRGGTGLGLSVAHGFVTEHGGSIKVKSHPGKGTKLCVRLPLAKEARDTEHAGAQ